MNEQNHLGCRVQFFILQKLAKTSGSNCYWLKCTLEIVAFLDYRSKRLSVRTKDGVNTWSFLSRNGRCKCSILIPKTKLKQLAVRLKEGILMILMNFRQVLCYSKSRPIKGACVMWPFPERYYRLLNNNINLIRAQKVRIVERVTASSEIYKIIQNMILEDRLVMKQNVQREQERFFKDALVLQ